MKNIFIKVLCVFALCAALLTMLPTESIEIAAAEPGITLCSDIDPSVRAPLAD